MMRSPATILRITVFLSFLGWGIFHLFWDLPYREFFWSEWLLKPVVEFSGVSWQQYVESPLTDTLIKWGEVAAGIILLSLSVLSLRPFDRRSGRLLWLGSVILFVVFLLYFKESGFKWGLLIEQAGQVFCPAILYLYMSGTLGKPQLVLVTKIVVAVTFTFHGLFAVGYYAVPGNFIDMVIGVFGVSENTARQILFAAGVSDIVLSIAIFIPRIEKPFLIYAVFWGLMTSLARPASLFGSGAGGESILYWTTQFLMRAPHFGLPLFLLSCRRNHYRAIR